MVGRRVLAGVLIATVLIALAVGFTWAQPAQSDRTIDRCTVIDEPGEYRLESDVHGFFGDCIVIEADGVTLDGDGHAITGSGTGTGVVVSGDVDLRNVHIERWRTGVRTEGSPEVRVENTTVRDGEVGVAHTGGELVVYDAHFEELTVAGVQFPNVGISTVVLTNTNISHTGAAIEATQYHYGDVTIYSSDIADNAQVIDTDGFSGLRFDVQNSRIADNDRGLSIGTSRLDVRDTDIVRNGQYGIRADGWESTPRASITIQDSVLAEHDGPGIDLRLGSVSVERTRIIENGHGLVAGAGEHGSPTAAAITNSTIAGNDIGLELEGDDVAIDARTNYWGAPNGPGSPDALRDAQTGGYAVGDGDVIIGDGIAFDPFFETDSGPAIDAPTGASYDLQILAIDDAVIVGESLRVSVIVENTINLDGDEQTIAVDVGGDGTVDATTEVTLEAGESAHLEFEIDIPIDRRAGSTPVVVRSENDSVEMLVEIETVADATPVTLTTDTPTPADRGTPTPSPTIIVMLVALGAIVAMTYLASRRV